jgi:FKBP-type peptidyl-prolyl cis-trans isomerase FkpA
MYKTNRSIRAIFLLFLGILVFSACKREDSRIEEERVKLQQYLTENGYLSEEPTSSGLYHIVLTPGTGNSPARTDYVNILFNAYLIDGYLFETSDESLALARGILREDKIYGPTKFLLESLGIAGLTEGITLMNEGGKSKFIIPSKLAFGSVDYGIIPPYSTLIYEVELVDVISDPAAHEQDLLDQYISDNEILEVPTESGLYYIEDNTGTGESPLNNSTVSLIYKGSLLDGRVFEEVSAPYTFALNTPGIIPGLVEGILKMKEGGSATLILPWNIAYGAQGSTGGFIPPYTTLVFEIILADIQ